MLLSRHTRRREFITLIGGVAALPLAAHAQQREKPRRVGVLTPFPADDAEMQARNAAFLQGLSELGWSLGRNVQIDYCWNAHDADRMRKCAAELVALAPDVILVNGSHPLAILLQVTRAVAIVFVQVTDPVGAGFVESLARPGGNATGFTPYEFGTSGKYLGLLKEIAPGTTRAAVIRDPTSATGLGQFAAIQSIAPSLGVELSAIGTANAAEIEHGITAFARRPNGGLIVSAGNQALSNRGLLIGLAKQHRLPAVYPSKIWVKDGGLVSYGTDTSDPYRRAAGYIDRILKGEKPADLPVQAPTKYELVVNLKTARTLGLNMPANVLARADEAIE
jgi:ABC-type uncharacterized transport system substrate-binding protein